MNDKDIMSFAIARSADPIIKNPVLRDAMNKDLGPRIKVAERDNMNTPDLEQSPDSFLRPGETLEDFDVEFRRPNSDGGLIDEALDAYKYYIKTRKSRPSKKRYKEIPFTKFFEIYGRENFDDGGRIALGVGGMPYKIFGKNIDIPKIPGVQGPEQNKKSVEEGFKKLEKWLTNPTPEKWNKIFGKNNTFGRQLRAYLLDEPIDLRKGTGLKETNKKVFDAINVKQLLKPNSIEKINLLTTGGKDVSLKSIAAKTFGNLKYTLDEQIKEVENFQNGEQWLKRNRSESEIRKYANAIRSMQSEKSRLGGFPFGDNSEKKLWSNLYRASYRGDRIEIVGDFADGNLPINKEGKVDWKMVDKNNVPAWKRVQFVDLEAPKNKTFTWGGDFKKGDFAKQIDDTFGEGFFKKSTVAYDTQAKTGSKRDFTVEGGGKTIKNNVKVKLLTAEALAENPKATKTEIDKYIKDKSPRFNITEVHHPDGVGVNPYKTEPTFRYANRAVGKVELALKSGKITQAEAKIQIDKINKDIGPVRIKLDDGYYGNYKNTQKSIVEAGNKYIDYIDGKGGTTLSSGFNTDLFMKDPLVQKILNSKTGQAVKNAARGTTGAAGKVFGGIDVVIGALDYVNNKSKEQSDSVALGNAVQAMSINLLKTGDNARINEIKDLFVKNGGDGKIFDQATNLNVKDQEINDLIYNNKKTADRAFIDLSKTKLGLGESIDQRKTDYGILKKSLNEEIKNKIEERDGMVESYKTNLRVNEAGAPIQIGNKDFFSKPFKDIKRTALDKIESENKASFPMQKEQRKFTSGNIGNFIENEIITLNAKKNREEERLIKEMAENYPQELYRFNLERGMDPDNLIRVEDILDLKSKYPQLMGVNTTKYVKQADRKAEGGIIGLRSKYEYKK